MHSQGKVVRFLPSPILIGCPATNHGYVGRSMLTPFSLRSLLTFVTSIEKERKKNWSRKKTSIRIPSRQLRWKHTVPENRVKRKSAKQSNFARTCNVRLIAADIRIDEKNKRHRQKGRREIVMAEPNYQQWDNEVVVHVINAEDLHRRKIWSIGKKEKKRTKLTTCLTNKLIETTSLI